MSPYLRRHRITLKERVSMFVKKLWRFRPDSHDGIESRQAESMRVLRMRKSKRRFDV